MTKLYSLVFFSLFFTYSTLSAQNKIVPLNHKKPNFSFIQQNVQKNKSISLYIGEEQTNNDYLKLDLLNKISFDNNNHIQREISLLKLETEHNDQSFVDSSMRKIALNIENNNKIIEYYGDTAFLNYLNQIQIFEFIGVSPFFNLEKEINIGEQWIDSSFMPSFGPAKFKLVSISDNLAKIDVSIEVALLQEVQTPNIQFNFIGQMNGSIIINTDLANIISQRDYNFTLEGRTIYSETKLEIPSVINGSFSNTSEIL